jgi:hypothetical protein
MDELLDTSYRQEIRDDIETFCNRYPSVPILVTSRKVGYEQAPLNQERFPILYVAPFDTEQVEEYAMKWFALADDLTPLEQERAAETFLRESEIAPDLRTNPLMLALMCNLYRGHGYIPRNRPALYRKCSEMLFEQWDKRRGIYVKLPFEEHIRPAMMHLAHWIYSDETLQGGVTEQKLIAEAADYLCPRRFEDRDAAESAAREFIRFCRGRAWVFTSTGATKDVDLYQFTHRTFLEYFTAFHLVRMHRTPEDLAEALLPRIIRREWDVVAQLAVQIQNEQLEGAGDELLDIFIGRAQQAPDEEAQALLSFAARCLEFLVPSPRVTRAIVAACISHIFSYAIKRPAPQMVQAASPLHLKERGAEEIIGNLLLVAGENRDILADSLRESLIERISSANEKEAFLAMEIVQAPVAALVRVERRFVDFGFWENIHAHIIEYYPGEVITIASQHPSVCLREYWNDLVSIDQVMEWHGCEIIFREWYNAVFPTIQTSSLALGMVSSALSLPFRLGRPEYFEKASRVAEDLGRVLFGFSPIPITSGDVDGIKDSEHWLFSVFVPFKDAEGLQAWLDWEHDPNYLRGVHQNRQKT